MSEIAEASSEQEAGIEQISQAITEMDSVTQQNAALVEEAAAATGALEEQANALNEVVGVFKLSRDGQDSYTTAQIAKVQTTAKISVNKSHPRKLVSGKSSQERAKRPVEKTASASEDWVEF